MGKVKTTWGGKRKGAGPKSAATILKQIGMVLPAKWAETAANDLMKLPDYGSESQMIIALRDYAKRIREANAK